MKRCCEESSQLGISCLPPGPSEESQFISPLRHCTMPGARDFVADLARAGKTYQEIKETVDAAYGDQSLQKTAIYAIIKKVKAGESADMRHLNPKKTMRTPELIASVAAVIKEDRRLSMEKIAAAHGVSEKTIFKILHSDLGLEKKSARWVPKLLSDDQKQERVRICSDFIAAIHRRSKSMLDCIVTMDETMVSYHTPETKKQSKQWIPKGQPGPLKAWVHASRTKQMVVAFFDSRGLIYTHIVPRGASINATYTIKVLGKFLEHFKKKRPAMAQQQWWFHWDNVPVHTAASVKEWMAAKGIQVLEHPPYSPDLAWADFFLFRRVKETLAGITLDQESLKNAWEGVTRNITAGDYATAFGRWFERVEKCIRISGNFVKKS
jgi:histone-lysine N-methyltransferase SETMAR